MVMEDADITEELIIGTNVIEDLKLIWYVRVHNLYNRSYIDVNVMLCLGLAEERKTRWFIWTKLTLALCKERRCDEEPFSTR